MTRFVFDCKESLDDYKMVKDEYEEIKFKKQKQFIFDHGSLESLVRNERSSYKELFTNYIKKKSCLK